MGLPLGPSFANIFLCHHEQQWLSSCPQDFKPAHYFRYVDDTFLLFNQMSHAQKFLNYVNSKHPAIKFTIETENRNCLPFLDVNVRRFGNSFHTSVFRKPSFSGLTLSYFSFCCKQFKTNSIATLFHRAYNISSNLLYFSVEAEFVRNLFFSNGYPLSLIQSIFTKFMSSKTDPQDPVLTAPKKPAYFVIPYFGHKSVSLKIDLTNLISEYFPHIEPKLILVNSFSIGSFFPFKDAPPKCLRSCVIYKFRCVQPCTSAYVGSTLRLLGTRIAEHRGLSIRTGQPLLHPPSLPFATIVIGQLMTSPPKISI